MLRRRMLKTLGASLLNLLLSRSAMAAKPAAADLSVKAYGAIGDGRSHPISEWIPARYPDLRALQVDYPDARSLADEIDFVAINKAVRVAGELGAAVHLPAGTYRSWVYVRKGGVALIGAGSGACRIRLPDGARHAVVPESGGAPLEGVPCVIEAGQIGDGNHAVALAGLRIVGLTLDGNAAGTRAPADAKEDLFGWGLAFTNVSDVEYQDLAVIDCHAGGIGTFITSDRHVGEARIANCGEALRHPGFDINSSRHGRWTVRVEGCPYGVRLLDNITDCVIDARISDARLAGLVCDNQPVNASRMNSITAAIRGGCANSGAQIGDGWSQSRFVLRIEDVAGIGVNSVGRSAAMRGESRNRFLVQTAGCGGQSAVIGGSYGTWQIVSSGDGRGHAAGDLFAVDVHGSFNDLTVRIADDGQRRLRGLVFRPGARGNRTGYAAQGQLLERLNDQGSENTVLPGG